MDASGNKILHTENRQNNSGIVHLLLTGMVLIGLAATWSVALLVALSKIFFTFGIVVFTFFIAFGSNNRPNVSRKLAEKEDPEIPNDSETSEETVSSNVSFEEEEQIEAEDQQCPQVLPENLCAKQDLNASENIQEMAPIAELGKQEDFSMKINIDQGSASSDLGKEDGKVSLKATNSDEESVGENRNSLNPVESYGIEAIRKENEGKESIETSGTRTEVCEKPEPLQVKTNMEQEKTDQVVESSILNYARETETMNVSILRNLLSDTEQEKVLKRDIGDQNEECLTPTNSNSEEEAETIKVSDVKDKAEIAKASSSYDESENLITTSLVEKNETSILTGKNVKSEKEKPTTDDESETLTISGFDDDCGTSTASDLEEDCGTVTAFSKDDKSNTVTSSGINTRSGTPFECSVEAKSGAQTVSKKGEESRILKWDVVGTSIMIPDMDEQNETRTASDEERGLIAALDIGEKSKPKTDSGKIVLPEVNETQTVSSMYVENGIPTDFERVGETSTSSVSNKTETQPFSEREHIIGSASRAMKAESGYQTATDTNKEKETPIVGSDDSGKNFTSSVSCVIDKSNDPRAINKEEESETFVHCAPTACESDAESGIPTALVSDRENCTQTASIEDEERGTPISSTIDESEAASIGDVQSDAPATPNMHDDEKFESTSDDKKNNFLALSEIDVDSNKRENPGNTASDLNKLMFIETDIKTTGVVADVGEDVDTMIENATARSDEENARFMMAMTDRSEEIKCYVQNKQEEANDHVSEERELNVTNATTGLIGVSKLKTQGIEATNTTPSEKLESKNSPEASNKEFESCLEINLPKSIETESPQDQIIRLALNPDDTNKESDLTKCETAKNVQLLQKNQENPDSMEADRTDQNSCAPLNVESIETEGGELKADIAKEDAVLKQTSDDVSAQGTNITMSSSTTKKGSRKRKHHRR